MLSHHQRRSCARRWIAELAILGTEVCSWVPVAAVFEVMYSHTQVTDQGLGVLANLDLRALNLSCTRVSDEGMAALSHMPIRWLVLEVSGAIRTQWLFGAHCFLVGLPQRDRQNHVEVPQLSAGSFERERLRYQCGRNNMPQSFPSIVCGHLRSNRWPLLYFVGRVCVPRIPHARYDACECVRGPRRAVSMHVTPACYPGPHHLNRLARLELSLNCPCAVGS